MIIQGVEKYVHTYNGFQRLEFLVKKIEISARRERESTGN